MKKISKALTSLAVLGILCLTAFADNTYNKPLAPLETEQAKETAYNYTPKDSAPDKKDSASLYSILEGKGTEQSPYLIYYADELYYFADVINSGENNTAHFRLMNDIDLGAELWTPVGYATVSSSDSVDYSTCFSGVFDGNGYTVSNFKITNAQKNYIGFFGFVYNGTVKNLTLSDFEIDVTSDFASLYVGGIAGRCISAGEGKTVSIENCDVENGSVYGNNKGSTYAGGIAGYVMSSDSSDEIFVKDAHSRVNVVSYSSSESTYSARYNAYAGGLIGYVGATVNTSLTIENCSATNDVYAQTTKNSSYQTGGFAGGLTGFAGVSGETSVLNITNSYAAGDVDTVCTYSGYSGGFSAYFSAGAGVMNVSDCYSTGNVTGITYSETPDYNYMCIGSFAGAATQGTFVRRCFTAGNVKDFGSEDSYTGVFFGYNFGAQTENCFYPEGIEIDGVNENTADALGVSKENITNPESFAGFDFENVWGFFEEGYKYPMLVSNPHIFRITFLCAGEVFEEQLSQYRGSFTLPADSPNDYSDAQRDYVFSHWSLTDSGEVFDVKTVSVTDNITIYAVFTSTDKSFEIVFMNGSELFHTESLVYGSEIAVPEGVPTKASDVNFWYKFERWSLSADGSDKTDIAHITVNKALVFYAVFKGCDHSVWNGTDSYKFSSGAGTQSNPYLIRNGYELYYLASQVNNANASLASACYELCADIDLGENEWTPIGTKENPFSGVFDGNGYTISGFKLTRERTYSGLFGYISGAQIGRFALTDSVVDIQDACVETYAGFVVGYSADENLVYQISVSKNCTLEATSDKNVYAGGIAGYASSANGENLIYDCYVQAGICAKSNTDNAYAGYIAGCAVSTNRGNTGISNCYALGNLESEAGSKAYSGGIAGYISSSGAGWSGWYSESDASLSSTDDVVIHGCFAVGDVSASGADSANAGYIMGGANECAVVQKCYYYTEMKAEATSENGTATVCESGSAVTSDNFRNADFLIDNLGFDFATVWLFTDAYMYPSLKIMSLDKPLFNVSQVTDYAGTVSLDVKVMTIDASQYNVVLSVYSERGRLIGIKTVKIEDNTTPKIMEFTIRKDNVANADYIKVTVLDNQSRQLLFPEVFKEL